MSSFVVEDRTINEVVNYLETQYRYCNGDPGNHLATLNLLKEGGYSIDQPGEWRRLGKDLYHLNVTAFLERYEDVLEELHEEEIPPFEQQWFFCPNAVQAFKSLQCWRYQCSEGDIPFHPLFKLMEEVMREMAIDIVMDLADYHEARWG